MPESRVQSALLGLHAQTALHPGAGTALGVVDLPVQRERHTHWPTIPGSALKGVLRDAVRERLRDRYPPENGRTARRQADADEALITAFGPPTERASESAGALSFTDARLLAFPVRSLRGVFAWVTCASVVERLRRDLALAGRSEAAWEVPRVEGAEVALPSSDCPCLTGGGQIVLEEFLFQPIAAKVDSVAAWVAETVLPHTDAFAASRQRLLKCLLLISDDSFTHFARYATEVVARVRLNYETKTVADGALFYQEYLPPETLLYSVVLSDGARAPATGAGGDRSLALLRESLPPVIQLGGDQSTGKGYCSTRLAWEGGA